MPSRALVRSGTVRRYYPGVVAARVAARALWNNRRGVARFAQKAWRRFGGPQNKSSAVVTQYKDFGTAYRRRKASGRVKRKARRRLFRAVAEDVKLLPMQKFVLQTTSSNAVAIGNFNSSGIGVMVGTGQDAAAENSANADLRNIASLLTQQTEYTPGTKFFLDSMVLSVMVRAASTNVVPLILDVYECVARKDTRFSVATCYAQGIAQNNQLAGTSENTVANVSTFSTVDVSPFDSSLFGSNYIIRNSTRYVVDAGKVISFGRRYNRNKIINTDDFIGESVTQLVNGNMPGVAGVTAGFLIIGRVSDVQTSQVNFEITSSRRYNVKYDEKGDKTVQLVTVVPG